MTLKDVLCIVEEVKSRYPEEIFPSDGSIQGAGAHMARLTCDNILKEITAATTDEELLGTLGDLLEEEAAEQAEDRDA